MDRDEWRGRYVQYLINHAAFSPEFANIMYEAGEDDVDFNESPEDAAQSELSYWAEG